MCHPHRGVYSGTSDMANFNSLCPFQNPTNPNPSDFYLLMPFIPELLEKNLTKLTFQTKTTLPVLPGNLEHHQCFVQLA